jgi:putative membrane protein
MQNRRWGQQRGLWVVLAVLVLIVLAVPLLGGGMMGWGMMGPGMMGGWGGQGAPGGGWGWGLAMALGGLAMLAFWGALIVGVVLAIRAFTGGGGSPEPRGDAALDILKRRYGAGELTLEQYEEMRRVLEAYDGWGSAKGRGPQCTRRSTVAQAYERIRAAIAAHADTRRGRAEANGPAQQDGKEQQLWQPS